MHNRTCFANHMGIWLAEPLWLCAAVDAIRAGHWKLRQMDKDDDGKPSVPLSSFAVSAQPIRDSIGGIAYWQTEDGIAIIEIDGPLMKGYSKYGGTSTIHTRKALRQAVESKAVRAIMLHIDSPGGHVAGTMELAADVRAAAKIKPLAAHGDDLVASAAYWVGSSAPRLTLNAIGEAGSIGTVAVVYDQSEQYAAEGVKVKVVATGPIKGSFTPGTEITPEQIEYLQGMVNYANEHFTGAVRKNRGLSDAKMREATTGGVFGARKALSLGLIDAVTTFEDALEDLAKESRRRPAQSRERLAAELGLME